MAEPMCVCVCAVQVDTERVLDRYRAWTPRQPKQDHRCMRKLFEGIGVPNEDLKDANKIREKLRSRARARQQQRKKCSANVNPKTQ